MFSSALSTWHVKTNASPSDLVCMSPNGFTISSWPSTAVFAIKRHAQLVARAFRHARTHDNHMIKAMKTPKQNTYGWELKNKFGKSHARHSRGVATSKCQQLSQLSADNNDIDVTRNATLNESVAWKLQSVERRLFIYSSFQRPLRRQ